MKMHHVRSHLESNKNIPAATFVRVAYDGKVAGKAPRFTRLG